MKIEFDYQIVNESVTGYHGTDKSSGNSILKNGFVSSNADKSRLGQGVYFYEHAINHAYDWAFEQKRIPKENICVLRAQIVLGNCLNFTDPAHLEIVQAVASSLLGKLRDKGLKKLNDAIVINYICKHNDVDTVKAVFSSIGSKKLFEGSKLVRYQQIVLCVRNVRQIKKVTEESYD